jgi:hypothetical protein
MQYLGEETFLGCLTLFVSINGKTYNYKINGPYVRDHFLWLLSRNKGRAISYLRRMEAKIK